MFFLRAKTRNTLGDRYLEFSSGPSVVIEFRNGDSWQTPTECALDVAQIALFIRSDECERITGHFRSAGSSYSMYVVVGCERHVEIHNVTERFNVDSTSSNVGCYENRKSAALESSECRGPLKLRAISVDSLSGNSVSHEIFGETISAMLRSGEHQRLLDVSALEE